MPPSAPPFEPASKLPPNPSGPAESSPQAALSSVNATSTTLQLQAGIFASSTIRFGNAGVGTVRNPGITNVDFSLQKAFRVTESKRFEFRAEAFNIFNTPLFTGVGRTLGTSTFGKITAGQAERELQLGLKFYF